MLIIFKVRYQETVIKSAIQNNVNLTKVACLLKTISCSLNTFHTLLQTYFNGIHRNIHTHSLTHTVDFLDIKSQHFLQILAPLSELSSGSIPVKLAPTLLAGFVGRRPIISVGPGLAAAGSAS